MPTKPKDAVEDGDEVDLNLIFNRVVNDGHRSKCPIANVLTKLNEKNRASLIGWLAPESEVRHSVIAEVLKDAGHPIPAGAVSRHRRGLCRCQPND